MAKSTGIVLTATGIGLANEYVQTGKVDFRMGVAGLGVAAIFAGIERISEPGAVGLSVLMLIAVLFTPMRGKSPADTLIQLESYKPPPKYV